MYSFELEQVYLSLIIASNNETQLILFHIWHSVCLYLNSKKANCYLLLLSLVFFCYCFLEKL